MKSVMDENTPISWVTEMHGIPKLTLHDHIYRNVTNGDKPGPYQLLSLAEEEELSNFVVEVAQAGYEKLENK